MRASIVITLVGLLATPAVALADDHDAPRPPRPVRVSIGAGGSLLLTGQGDGARSRGDAHLDLSPGGRFGRWGFTGAIRHVVLDPFFEDALITGGVIFEAAAARPRLTMSLHADVGAQLASRAPAFGGGLATHLWLLPSHLRPVALVFDVTGHLVIDGADDTRFVIGSATRLTIAF